jgi:hypothetical protein
MDLQFTDEVLEIVKKATGRHRDDIERATKEAELKIRALENFDEIVGALVTAAVKELVYRERCVTNHRIKTETGQYGGAAKVVVGNSSGVQRAAESCYNKMIGGMRLGSILGKDLRGLAETEASLASGHSYNRALLLRLDPLVPADKRIQDAIPEKKLRKIMEQLRAKYRDRELVNETEKGIPVLMPLGERELASAGSNSKRRKQRAAALAKPR